SSFVKSPIEQAQLIADTLSAVYCRGNGAGAESFRLPRAFHDAFALVIVTKAKSDSAAAATLEARCCHSEMRQTQLANRADALFGHTIRSQISRDVVAL